MQEINCAGQERSTQSSERKEYRCRVCDEPIEWPDLVCRECWRREQEEQEWESYLEFPDDDTKPRESGNPPKTVPPGVFSLSWHLRRFHLK